MCDCCNDLTATVCSCNLATELPSKFNYHKYLFFFLNCPLFFMTNSKGWIFAAGVLALALSLYLWFSGSKQAGIFVGLWVPSLWILADLVNKTEATDT